MQETERRTLGLGFEAPRAPYSNILARVCRSRPLLCSNNQPTHEVAANCTGMAGADSLLIAAGSKRKLGLARSISRRKETQVTFGWEREADGQTESSPVIMAEVPSHHRSVQLTSQIRYRRSPHGNYSPASA